MRTTTHVKHRPLFHSNSNSSRAQKIRQTLVTRPNFRSKSTHPGITTLVLSRFSLHAVEMRNILGFVLNRILPFGL